MNQGYGFIFFSFHLFYPFYLTNQCFLSRGLWIGIDQEDHCFKIKLFFMRFICLIGLIKRDFYLASLLCSEHSMIVEDLFCKFNRIILSIVRKVIWLDC